MSTEQNGYSKEEARARARDLVTLAESAHRFYEARGGEETEEDEHLLVTIIMIADRAAELKEMLDD